MWFCVAKAMPRPTPGPYFLAGAQGERLSALAMGICIACGYAAERLPSERLAGRLMKRGSE